MLIPRLQARGLGLVSGKRTQKRLFLFGNLSDESAKGKTQGAHCKIIMESRVTGRTGQAPWEVSDLGPGEIHSSNTG